MSIVRYLHMEMTANSSNKPIALVIYGQDLEAKAAVTGVMKALGFSIREFSDAKKDLPEGERPFNSEIVKNLFKDVQLAIVVLSHDEDSVLVRRLLSPKLNSNVQSRSRPNVYFEYGMALSELGSKVLSVTFGIAHLDLPSDELGLNPIEWTNALEVGEAISDSAKRFGICFESDQELLKSISYIPAIPDFESTTPPYDFIANPWSLDFILTNAIHPASKALYVDAGFEIDSSFFTSHRFTFEEQGWRPLIHKDMDGKGYVRLQSPTGAPDIYKIWVARRMSSPPER